MNCEEAQQVQGWIERTEREVNHMRPWMREDLIQCGWETALRAWPKYKTSEGMSVKTWIITHLRRDMVRMLEQEAKHEVDEQLSASGGVAFADYESIDILPDDLVDDSFDERLCAELDIAKCADILHEREAKCIEMYYNWSLSENQIAAIWGVSRSMVRKVRERAVAKIQQAMGVPNS